MQYHRFISPPLADAELIFIRKLISPAIADDYICCETGLIYTTIGDVNLNHSLENACQL